MEKQEIQNLIKEFMDKLTVPADSVFLEEENGFKSSWFSVEVKEPYFFLERGGEGVMALNHLIRKIIESKTSTSGEERSERNHEATVIIDVNGFQKKRVEGIRSIAHMMAERARYFKSNIEVDPMSAFERRIVHEFLSDATDLKTESQGVGPTRRVIIKYIGEL